MTGPRPLAGDLVQQRLHPQKQVSPLSLNNRPFEHSGLKLSQHFTHSIVSFLAERPKMSYCLSANILHHNKTASRKTKSAWTISFLPIFDSAPFARWLASRGWRWVFV